MEGRHAWAFITTILAIVLFANLGCAGRAAPRYPGLYEERISPSLAAAGAPEFERYRDCKTYSGFMARDIEVCENGTLAVAKFYNGERGKAPVIVWAWNIGVVPGEEEPDGRYLYKGRIRVAILGQKGFCALDPGQIPVPQPYEDAEGADEGIEVIVESRHCKARYRFRDPWYKSNGRRSP